MASNSYYPTIESMFKAYVGLQNRSQTNYTASFSLTKVIKVEHITCILFSLGKKKPTSLSCYLSNLKNEKYDSLNELNDIAVLKLSEPVPLGMNVQLACLPQARSSTYPSVNTSVWAIGWGTNAFAGTAADTLNQVELSVLDSASCSYLRSYFAQDERSQMCAGDLSGARDTCQVTTQHMLPPSKCLLKMMVVECYVCLSRVIRVDRSL